MMFIQKEKFVQKYFTGVHKEREKIKKVKCSLSRIYFRTELQNLHTS